MADTWRVYQAEAGRRPLFLGRVRADTEGDARWAAGLRWPKRRLALLRAPSVTPSVARPETPKVRRHWRCTLRKQDAERPRAVQLELSA